MSDYKRPSDAELKAKLSREQYAVACNSGTEPPFRNAYWDNHEAGLYVDVVSGEPLFTSLDKFDSGTGWPSFTKPVEDKNVVELADHSHGMTRVEVRSKHGDSHLGHLFDDGPAPTGQRFCINSASLRFIPVAELEKEGYGEYAKLFGAAKKSAKTETTIFAGGCFWGMEEILRAIPGVLRTEVGYIGGTTKDPKYPEVHEGKTGHAEAVEVEFDPAKVSFETLLKWFFRMHDPTTKDRQGNDIGTSYRSAIFYRTDEQKKQAEAFKARLNERGRFGKPIVTEIVKAGAFYPAEDYHQDYLQQNPGGYTCHFLRPESVLGE